MIFCFRELRWIPILMLSLAFFLPFAASEEKAALPDPSAAASQPARPQPLTSAFDPAKAKVETVADTLEYSRKDNKVIATGNVVIVYGQDKITADYAEVETETKQAYAKGHVIIFSKDTAKITAPEVHYNFETHSGVFPSGSVIDAPWHCSGEDMEQLKKGVVKAKSGRATTCKGVNPPFEIRAKKITIHEDDKLIARNVTIYSLGRPIFWWPYLIVPLQQNSLPFEVKPGYNSRHGAYIETTKGFSVTKNVYGKLHADWRAKRGFGGGGDLDYDFGPAFDGVVRGYWTQDNDAPTPGRRNPWGETEDRDRGRISWLHKSYVNPDTYLQLRYHRLADEYFLQDFFEQEHRSEVEPQSFVTVTHNSERYGALAHFSKKMNGFETTLERLPELRFDWKTAPFVKPWIFYENQSSISSLAKRYSRSDMNQDVFRSDHVSRWFVPLNHREIKLTPYFLGRGTYYSREKESDNDHFRAAAGWGADLRTQLYKTFDIYTDKFGIEVNRLRHVLEPYVTYDSLKSSVSDEKLEYFDLVDGIDDKDVITLGLENRLQTKRVVNGKMQRVDFVSLNSYVRYEANPDNEDSVSAFTAFGQEAVLRPYDWLQYELRAEFNPHKSEMTMFNQDLLVRVKRLDLLFGHRFINDVEHYEGSNQFVFDGKFWVNNLWSLGGYIRWDGKGQELEEWQVYATRDMECLVLDFGYNVRNSSVRSNNKELFFQLRLKDFPQYNLRGGGSRASIANPRIGETVAGANQFSAPRSYYQERYGPRAA